MISLDPGDSESQLLLVDVLRQVGQLDDAVPDLGGKLANKKEPNNPIYELTLADLLSKTDRDDEAIKLLEDMLKRHADNDQVVTFIRQNLSVIYVNRRDFAKGEAQLELLLQRNPDDPGPNNDLGYLYAEQGKNLEKAESMIRKALAKKTLKATPISIAWDGSCSSEARSREASGAAARRRASEQMKSEGLSEGGLGPDCTILEHLGDVYFQLQQLDQASDAWRQAVKAAAQAIPPDKRLTEIRKKIESLEKLGPVPKPAAERTP